MTSAVTVRRVSLESAVTLVCWLISSSVDLGRLFKEQNLYLPLLNNEFIVATTDFAIFRGG